MQDNILLYHQVAPDSIRFDWGDSFSVGDVASYLKTECGACQSPDYLD